mmetsp:Transcript_3747/g.11570  ORF Transcript_3747/g.11570 Transcript_3747/m.11570 type:complete len:102 (+) Transcript_3747:267-572(+)|eukprot:scaffold323918_cov107-Tisochrysis_lutea.AAC.1
MAKYLECDVSNALITPESVAARFGPAAAGATTDATIWFVEGLFGMRDSDGPLWLANDPSLGKPRCKMASGWVGWGPFALVHPHPDPPCLLLVALHSPGFTK